MTFKEMQTEVEINVKDSAFFSMIPGVINNVFEEVVNEAKPPSLKIPSVVSTVVGQSYVNIPSGLFGSLLFVGDTDNKRELVVAKGGLEELLSEGVGLDSVGDVWKVALEGNVLWYIKQPSVATALVLLLLKKPTALALDNSTPDEYVIPAYLHRQTLVYGASAVIWNIMEEGIEGEKVNTMGYAGRFQLGKTALSEWVGKQKRHMSRSVWWY